MADNKESLVPIVESLMEKQRKQNDQLKAEQVIELNSMKEDIMGEVKKVTDGLGGLQKNIDVMETKMQKANLSGGGGKKFSERIHANLMKGKDMFHNEWGLKKGSNDFSFTLEGGVKNQVIVIHDPTSFVAGDAPVVLPFRDAGVDKAPKRALLVSDIIQWGTTTSNMVDWIERTGKTAGAAMRAEDAIMGQGDLEYTEVSTKVKIASQFMKVTNESLKDVDFLASEINTELLEDLRILVDDQLLAGDGQTVNLLGIVPQATEFTPGKFATGQPYAVTEPNNMDVLRVAVNQIWIAGKGKFIPNYILMHPTDVASMDVLKIADGRYIEVPYYNPDGPSVVTIPIVQNVGIDEGTYLVGDFMRAKAFMRDALTIRIYDQNADDPIYNRSTVTANIRLAFRIKNQDKPAFVTGTFATDKAAISVT